MLVRAASVIAVAVALTGCANDRMLPPMGLGFAGLANSVSSSAQPSLGEASPVTLSPGMKQTLGGKVLSAIALERVTGRKPDPSRFRELN